jgi:ABC-2 type transport system permease protein
MTAIVHQARASYAFIERNLNLIKRYWGWEAVWMAYTIANSLAVSYIGAGMEQISGQKVDSQYLVLYLVIGTIVWRYLAVTFHAISDMIGWERWEGTIEYTLMAPIPRITHLVGQTFFAIIYSLIHTAAILLVTQAFFNLNLQTANLMGGLVLLLAGSLSFIGIGIVAAILPLLFPERGSQMTHLILAVLLFVSGVYYPVTVLPTWLQPIAQMSPATYVLEGMRDALLKGAPLVTLWPYLWPLLLMGGVAIPLGVRIFQVAERYAKRTGRLKRNG